MAKTSAGILLFTRKPHLQVLLAHPGGPYWQNKDEEAWSIPKGEVEEHEDLLDAAKREFHEELGFVPEGTYLILGSVKQKGEKPCTAGRLSTRYPMTTSSHPTTSRWSGRPIRARPNLSPRSIALNTSLRLKPKRKSIPHNRFLSIG